MKGKKEQIYQLLLGILLACALPVMALLGYWACRYSYCGAVDGRFRGVLVRDNTWAHIAAFLAVSLCTMAIDKTLIKKISPSRKRYACVR